MLDSGLATAHPFGGVVVDFDTNELCTRTGTLLSGVFALGALTSGTHFWTNAMNVNARLARNIVQILVQSGKVKFQGLASLPKVSPTQISQHLPYQ